MTERRRYRFAPLLAAAGLSLGPTLSALQVPAVLLMILGTSAALWCPFQAPRCSIAPSTAALASYYALYLGLGLYLGGFALSIDHLTTELRWLPPVISAFALAVSADKQAGTFLKSLPRFVEVGLLITLLSPMFSPAALRAGELWGLTSSHHVPGIMAGGYLVLMLARPDLRRARANLLWLAIASVVLVLSQSRISLLAVGLSILIRAMKVAYRKQRTVDLAVAAVLAFAAAAASPRFADTLIWLLDDQSHRAIGAAWNGEQVGGSYSAVEFNVLERFALFGSAFRDFRDHWILGIGPGRFNDRSVNPDLPLGGSPWPPRSTEFVPIASEMTAHNMYMQVAVETGIVGLVLFLVSISRWVLGPRRSALGQFLLVQGVSSGALISIAATSPWLAAALLMSRLPAETTDAESADQIERRRSADLGGHGGPSNHGQE